MATAIWWIRRDLRLQDNPALAAACESGTVVPVYVHAPEEESPWAPGDASRVWLRKSLQTLDARLRARGSALVVRRGPSLAALRALVQELGAEAVHWNRLYEPATIARDAGVKEALQGAGLQARSHAASLLFEPWQVQTESGTPYRVFTPFWRKAQARLETLPPLASPPQRLPGVSGLRSEALDQVLPAPRPSWDRAFWTDWEPGEDGAGHALDAFVDGALAGYCEERDRPDHIGTSRLSPHLHFGEISPHRILATLRERVRSAALDADVAGYIRELGWREFSHHLLFHFPTSAEVDFNPRFAGFKWATTEPDTLQAWQRGRTGVPIVDAGMRELWHSGWMHNRVRMIVASFLCKNLRQHWLHGARWFWDCLLDADLANNTLGWQWSAGTGADAAPYFRIFNPVAQARRFDPDGHYVRRWLPELAALPDAALFAPWEHPELLRRLAPAYPQRPIVDLSQSRAAALAAYRALRE